VNKLEKIFVKCYYCNKKMRIRKEIDEKAVYYLEGGTAKVIGNRLFFFCDDDRSLADL